MTLYLVGAMVVCAEHCTVVARLGSAVEMTEDERNYHTDQCAICQTPARSGRVCMFDACGRDLHPQWPALYCSNECARKDAFF
jgi:hypothetical protein